MSNIEEMRRDRKRIVDAKRRKRNALARLQGQPVGMVDAAPIRNKAAALFELGWSYEAIVHAARVPATSAGLRLIANGVSRKSERKWEPVANLPYTLAIPAHVPETCIIPTLGATRRVRSLMAQGWRHEDISEYIGRSSHHLSSGRYPRMTALDWHVVDAAYQKLSASDGGSARTKARALAAGFLPSLCWDDIDDPTAHPIRFRADDAPDPVVIDRILGGDMSLARTATRAEKVEVVRRWVEAGRSLTALEKASGWNCQRYVERGAA